MSLLQIGSTVWLMNKLDKDHSLHTFCASTLRWSTDNVLYESSHWHWHNPISTWLVTSRLDTFDMSLCIVTVPFALQDIIGKRGILAVLCGLLTVPVFAFLGFTYIHPLVSTLLLGIMYSFAAVYFVDTIHTFCCCVKCSHYFAMFATRLASIQQ